MTTGDDKADERRARELVAAIERIEFSGYSPDLEDNAKSRLVTDLLSEVRSERDAKWVAAHEVFVFLDEGAPRTPAELVAATKNGREYFEILTRAFLEVVLPKQDAELARYKAVVEATVAHLAGAQIYDSPCLEEIHDALVTGGFITASGERIAT